MTTLIHCPQGMTPAPAYFQPPWWQDSGMEPIYLKRPHSGRVGLLCPGNNFG